MNPNYANEVAALVGGLYNYWENTPEGQQVYMDSGCGMDSLWGASLRLAVETMRLIDEIVDFEHPDYPLGVFAYDYCVMRQDGGDLCTHLTNLMYRDDWYNLSQNWLLPEKLEAGVRRWAQLIELPIKEVPQT